MTVDVIPFAVDLSQLAAATGSEDPALHEALGTDDRTPRATALGELIDGLVLDPDREEDYVDALAALCGHLGVLLNNRGLAPLDIHAVESVDELLARHPKIAPAPRPVALYDLLYRGSPIDLPQSGRLVWPQVGYWTADEVHELHEALTYQRLESDDDPVEAILVTLEDLVAVAAARKAALVAITC